MGKNMGAFHIIALKQCVSFVWTRFFVHFKRSAVFVERNYCGFKVHNRRFYFVGVAMVNVTASWH